MTHDSLLVSRREMLALFGMGLLASRELLARQQEPEFSGLDHIEFYVSNVEKSRDFFVRIFGKTLLNRAPKRYLKLGSTYMAFEPPRGAGAAGRVDHVSAAIKRLDMPRFHSFLEQRGLPYQDYPSGRDTAVTDPDGTRLQLSPEDGWGFLNPATFLPETVTMAEAPIFQPIGLDHVLFNVSDTEKAMAFYQKLLGSPSQRDAAGTWYRVGASRIGIQQTPAGERPGVHRVCVSAAAFSDEVAASALQQIGAKVQPAEVPGAVAFRDLDGLLFLVSKT